MQEDDVSCTVTVSDGAVKEHLAIVKEIRKKAALKSQKMDEQMVKKKLSKNPPSTYSIGDSVLMKAPAKNKSSNRVKGKGDLAYGCPLKRKWFTMDTPQEFKSSSQ